VKFRARSAQQARARDLNVRARPPEPILMGRHLIEAGLRPGKDFAGILGRAYEAQLEGAFGDLPGAFAWLVGSAAFAFSEEAKTKLRARAEGAA
jgi:hypothetical protein